MTSGAWLIPHLRHFNSHVMSISRLKGTVFWELKRQAVLSVICQVRGGPDPFFWVAFGLPQTWLGCILDASKPDGSRAIVARSHQQQLSMLIVTIRLGKIPL